MLSYVGYISLDFRFAMLGRLYDIETVCIVVETQLQPPKMHDS